MNQFTEDSLVEQTVIKLIQTVWADPSCHINAFKDEDDRTLGRDNRSEVVLKKYLLSALQILNPNLPYEAITQAAEIITSVRANQEIYKLLKDGVTVEVPNKHGDIVPEKVTVLDLENPTNNHFLAVSQLWIAGEMYTRRTDVVLFVNGIPLLLLELKAAHKNLANAYQDNIRDYQTTIPKLFWYTMGIIISNGIESKLGSITASFEFYNEWKKVASEDDESNTNLATIINGICDKSRLLDIFENYILFEEARGDLRHIVPRYFQYYGVNRAFENVVRRHERQGKLGVFWHTQGSGKSYSMVFLSQKVLRKLRGNFTFVIVTDRTQLDGQAYDNFKRVGAIYESDVHAGSIEHLKELLGQDHRQIFTTIQKFQDIPGTITDRSDIIVMTDEAHRTQYDKMAQNMRKALPKASFIGFTGTPLIAGDEPETVRTFGEYVSVYNFGQSVADGATVPLYYENRVPRLKNVNDNLEEHLAQLLDRYDLDEDQEEKLEQEYSTLYEIITREDRLNTIARDIVEHFAGRGYNGKAMVVSVDKKTTFRMFDKVQKEWQKYLSVLASKMQRAHDDHEREQIENKIRELEQVDMAVIVSLGDNQNEQNDMAEFDIDIKPIRDRILKKTSPDGKVISLEDEFKDPNSSLRIVFVCAMWLTGFDVPNISTLYLDKPLKNHTLMQTIARANRVADEGKTHGLIVDYIGVFKNIERALALYAANGADAHDIIKSKEELVRELEEMKRVMEEFLGKQQISIQALLAAPPQQKLLLIYAYANQLIAVQEVKKQFLNLATGMFNGYKAVLPEPDAEQYYQYVTAVRVIASRIREVGRDSFDSSHIKKELEELLNKSIQAGDYVISPNRKVKDLSKLDADKLKEFFESLENKNLQTEAVAEELKNKIEEMMRKNRKRARFMERLLSLLEEYNSGAHDVEELFNNLIELAKDLDEEEQRAVKEEMTEEQLAIFDLLMKDDLTPDEVALVKGTSLELLQKLQPLLVQHWRDFETNRAGVKTVISDFLYAKLPEPAYTEKDCELMGYQLYSHFFENYMGNNHI
jgi:type I restriction enzyme R subunit